MTKKKMISVFLVVMLSVVLSISVFFGGHILVNGDEYMRESNIGYTEIASIEDVLMSADSIDVVIGGNRINGNVTKIKGLIKSMLEGYHEMPAFGVSLDTETRNAMQVGVWLELKYRETHTHNEMPFDTLLIEVKPDYEGFNLMRQYNNKYEGRCFYINLNGNMEQLHSYLTMKTVC